MFEKRIISIICCWCLRGQNEQSKSQ